MPESGKNPHKVRSAKEVARLVPSLFDEREYCCYKALQFFQDKANGGLAPEEICANMPQYAQQMSKAIKNSGLNPLSHYRDYGTCEGLNPSNRFSTLRYLAAKARALNAAGSTDVGCAWDAWRVALAFKRLHISALEHFLQFAGTGPGEVAEALGPNGEVPEAFQVPPWQQVDVEGGREHRAVTYTLSRTGQMPEDEHWSDDGEVHSFPKRVGKDFFSEGEYLQFKALQFFQQPENGGLSAEQIRHNMPLYAAEILRRLRAAKISPWTHYRKYGFAEGINPCNAFDTIAYLEAKARALNAQGSRNQGQPWDSQAVVTLLRKAHISALEHFLLYAGTGPGEVEQGLTEDGQIPAEFGVPDLLHVMPLEVPHLDDSPAPKAQVPANISQTDKPVVQFAGKRAVHLAQTEKNTAPERLPDYYFLPRKGSWQGVASGVSHALWRKSLSSRLILLFVIVPGIFIFFYLLFWASHAYISQAKFAVRGQNASQSLEGFSTLFSLPSSTQNDSYIVLNYILSYDMFSHLDQSLHLREHYSDRKNDIWYRLEANATHDEILDFWNWACEVTYDPDTSILEVQVKAFTPEMALAICQGILTRSEELVNAMNTRSRRDAIVQAEVEVRRAEDRIRKAREAMHQYRERTVILDPEAVATGLYGLVNKLESDVARTQSELSEALTFMKPSSPRVRQLENRLQVLNKQLASEKRRLAGKIKDDKSLNDLLSGFQALTLEEEFAQKQLTSAMTSLEAARVRADAQTQYVEAFQRPVLADESLYPRPVLFTFIYMLTSLLLLGLLSLIVAAVREHAGF